MPNSPQRYAMNFSWVWGPDNPELDKVARLAVTVRDADHKQLDALLETWLDTLKHDGERGHYIRGGFSVGIQGRSPGSAEIVFTSGGQDVADSLGYAVDGFYEKVLQHLGPANVSWTELPLLK